MMDSLEAQGVLQTKELESNDSATQGGQ